MKYAVNDYIVQPETIFLKVVAAFDSNEEVVYGLYSHKGAQQDGHGLSWHTEYELDNLGFIKGKPEFDKWAALKEGDMFYNARETHYHKVIARVGDAVLISLCPQTRDERNFKADIQKQIDELTEHLNMPTRVATKLKQDATGSGSMPAFDAAWDVLLMPSNAYHVPSNGWETLHDLALMNWRIVEHE